MLDPLQRILSNVDTIINYARPGQKSKLENQRWISMVGEMDSICDIHDTLKEMKEMEQIVVTTCPCCGATAQAIEEPSSPQQNAQVRYRVVDLGLTFTRLRSGNTQRLPLFKNRLGEPAHSQPDGSDWTIAEWGNAMAGEAGEACNIAKKIRRGDFAENPELGFQLLLEEIADVIIYADIMAFRAGGSLGEAVKFKFNKTSVRVGCDIRI
jgi:NTP pyrophosphatase (non-canonical NTP hydrolase)